MTPDDPVIAKLSEANPVADADVPTAADRAQAERTMQRVLSKAPPVRRRPLHTGVIAPVISVVVVLIVAAVILRTGGSSPTGSSSQGGLRITLVAEPTAHTPRITPTVMSHELDLVRRRLRSILHGSRVTRAGATGVLITGPKVPAAERARIVRLVTQPAQLYFYDWEASVLAPDGHALAQKLRAPDRATLTLSQGTSGGPGMPGAGSTSLYDAVRRAARQPSRDGGAAARRGPEYLMFGAPGSAACAAAGAADRTVPVHGDHCLLAGPVDVAAGTGRRQALNALAAQLPAGVSPGSGQVLVVPEGTRVVQAQPSAASEPKSFSDPSAQFFVLRDDPGMSGADIVDPSATTDQSGSPAVNFGFTASGRRAFQRTTGEIARRAANVSMGGQTLSQHFAVVLDDQLLTVPSIDFRQYPDGVAAANGADITGGMTAATARDLATQLRSGPLPLALRVVS